LNNSSTLFIKLSKKNFRPEHVCEVGVYLPETCMVRDFIEQQAKATLVEANPVMVEKIKDAFKGFPKVSVYPYAVSDQPGRLTLYNRGASTFVENIKSPAIVNDQYGISDADKFEVEAVVFDQIDDGSINLLCIDIEGAEWQVLSHLKSKPSVISVETHGKYYTNPKLTEIKKWMDTNGYDIWYKDKSDSVFVKKDIFKIESAEKLKLSLMELYLSLRKLKGNFLNRKKD